MPAPVSAASITKFPHGVSSFGMPVVGGGRILTTGHVFFVDSTAGARGDDTSHGTTPETPFATLDFAIGQCQANSGDVIFVLPGHNETLTTAGAINCDVNGVSIIGVTYNEGRDRPIFTFASSVTASIDINGSNVTIENVVLNLTGIDSLITGINVQNADFSLRGCEVILATIGNQALSGVTTNPNASRMTIANCYFHGEDVVGTVWAIVMDGAGTADGMEISYNRFVASFSGAAITDDPNATGAICTNLYIHHNVAIMLSTGQNNFVVIGESLSMGLISHNEVVGSALQAMLLLINNVAAIENYGFVEGSPQQAGQLIPLTGTGLGDSHSLVDQIIGADISGSREQPIKVTADFTSATWNTVAVHTLATIASADAYRVRILPICSNDLVGGGSISLGTNLDTVAFIAATVGTDIDAGEIWLSTTPATQVLLSGLGTEPGLFVDALVSSVSAANKVVYEITTAAFTAGSITFYIWWENLTNPLSGFFAPVAAGTGGP